MAEIFFIHGMLVGGWVWKDYQAYFEAKGYHCTAPTLRFHAATPEQAGAPPHPKLGTTSLLDYLQDLEEEIRALDERPIIIGHSMGGLLAQILTGRGLARACVALTPAVPSKLPKPNTVRGFLSCITRWRWWQKPARPTFTEAAWMFMNRIPQELRPMYYETLGYESGRVLLEIGNGFLDSKKAARVNFSGVDCPALLISAAEDRIIPARQVKHFSANYRQVTYRDVPGHAHLIISEEGWQEVADYIFNWLQKIQA